jgi:hypothetical protein
MIAAKTMGANEKNMRMKARSNPRGNVNGSNRFREEAMKTVARATQQLHAKPER